MEISEVKKILEALLFVSEKPLNLKHIQDAMGNIDNNLLKEAIKELKEEFTCEKRGIQLVEIAGGMQFCTNPEYSQYLIKLYKTKRVFRLSAPALETIAIIAYKQPVTRSEIEFIRGVNVDGVIKTLLERDLIKEKGRKEVPGRPIMYATSEGFLHYFGLKSLKELPPIEKLAPKELETNADDNLAPKTEDKGQAEVISKQPGQDGSMPQQDQMQPKPQKEILENDPQEDPVPLEGGAGNEEK